MLALSLVFTGASCSKGGGGQSVGNSPIPVYRVVDIDKPGVPALSTEQLAWLKRIEGNLFYAKRLDSLWFANLRASKHPLVVYLASPNRSEAASTSAFWVIGEACNDYFNVNRGENPWPDETDEICTSGRGVVN